MENLLLLLGAAFQTFLQPSQSFILLRGFVRALVCVSRVLECVASYNKQRRHHYHRNGERIRQWQADGQEKERLLCDTTYRKHESMDVVNAH